MKRTVVGSLQYSKSTRIVSLSISQRESSVLMYTEREQPSVSKTPPTKGQSVGGTETERTKYLQEILNDSLPGSHRKATARIALQC